MQISGAEIVVRCLQEERRQHQTRQVRRAVQQLLVRQCADVAPH
mgnify:CR=1 FL=1